MAPKSHTTGGNHTWSCAMDDTFVYIEDTYGDSIEIYIDLFESGKYYGVYITGADAGVEIALTDTMIKQVQQMLDSVPQHYDDTDDLYDELLHTGGL